MKQKYPHIKCMKDIASATLKEACRRHFNHKLKKNVVDMQTSFTSDTAYVERDMHIIIHAGDCIR